MMTRIATLAGIGLALFGAGWLQGQSAEREAWTARAAALTAERDRAAARVAGLSQALDQARAERARLAAQLEDQADADDDADRPALPARSLRRLDAR